MGILLKKQTSWPQSASELYRLSDRRFLVKLVPTFVDRGCCVVSATDSHGRILGFLDRSRYYFFQIAPQLYPRGWVDPVLDPLLLRKSGSAGNRIWDHWICSRELWQLDHTGSLAILFTSLKMGFIWTIEKYVSKLLIVFLKLCRKLSYPLMVLYSGGAEFVPRSGHILYHLHFSWVSSIVPSKCWYTVHLLIQETAIFFHVYPAIGVCAAITADSCFYLVIYEYIRIENWTVIYIFRDIIPCSPLVHLQRIMLRYVSEQTVLQNHRCENLKACKQYELLWSLL
jgi:hypothetical protein